ncbi:1-acyl-sn-glycerol-3-phosphate acyltransferase [Hanstruepera marina]|uniref:1-acyl-sn-glycerol-3-phosphate acyltransferase n=1 Tax=Hanstruepera marina TaxID=2873265 RepID=UPI001CA5F7F5|nr:1-acyl-sn-glycerol-3-phosphate acyltransferase [Hanstruepera marina]
MAELFYRTYQLIKSNTLVSLLGFIAILLGLIFLASRIEFEEDITKLIPTSEQNADAQKVLKTANFADKIIVNISREPHASVEDLTAYASQFIDSLNQKSRNYYTQIQGQIPEESVSEVLNFVYENLPLFLDASDYATIQKKLNKDSLEVITRANYKALISPSGIIAKETILKDPLGLSFIALKKLQQLSFGDAFILENGYLLSKDKNHILLFITPKHKSSETAENAVFADQLYELNSDLNSSFNGKVSSEYFGGVLIAVANAKQIKRDIQITVGIAMSILLLILIVFYKKLSIPLILFTPTAFGALLAVALLFVIRTKISAISLGIGSVLLGITLDYALHILTHIRSNNNPKILYQEITKPILMSSLTTAMAFLCLLFLKSQALQDLGIFAAISVLGASVFSLIFIPLVYRTKVDGSGKQTLLDKIAYYPFHKNKWFILGVVMVLTISAFTYNKTQFNNDISQLNYEPQELLDAQNRLDALTNISSKSIYLVAYGNSIQEAMTANDSIYSKLQNLKQNDEIIDYSSIGALIQSDKKQKNAIRAWEDFWTDATIEKTKLQLIESGETLGFKPNTHQSFYNLLSTDFKPLNLNEYSTINTISIDDYISTQPDFTTITSLAKVKDNQVENLLYHFKGYPQTLAIDRKQMNETFLGGLKTDFNRLVTYSLIVVLILLLLFYRSVSLTLVTSLPIALTWLVTIGLMGILQVQFNIFNIIISTFIFGLGIDYSIFITNGLLHELKTGERVLPTHKTSIVLSVITTILGVGVLIFAKHPALYSISLVSIIGILSAVCLSFIIQPVIFKFFIGSKSNRPSPILMFIHSSISFTYYGLGGLILSLLGIVCIKIIPLSMKIKMKWFHKIMSRFMKSVLDSYPFFKTRVLNPHNETFEKQAVIIANHTSFLDILAIGMLHPKIIFLVNDWVYNSPFFGKAVKLAGFYPVSSGIEKGVDHLQKKVEQGYSLMAFPEGTRSYTNKMKRFHKGAFFLAEQFNLDIVPVIIHGNSEILPKGNFVIKSGALSVKILDRIAIDNPKLGPTTRDKTKYISQVFKTQFKAFRQEHEGDTYFHKVVLEEYRYKGHHLYKSVKQDLNTNKTVYKTVMDSIGEKDSITHLSDDHGQLDFLLALDSPSRQITTWIENDDNRKLVKSSYITNNHYKITVTDTIEESLNTISDILIIDLNLTSSNHLEAIYDKTYSKIILLKSGQVLKADFVSNHYKVAQKSTHITYLIKSDNT